MEAMVKPIIVRLSRFRIRINITHSTKSRKKGLRVLNLCSQMFTNNGVDPEGWFATANL